MAQPLFDLYGNYIRHDLEWFSTKPTRPGWYWYREGRAEAEYGPVL